MLRVWAIVLFFLILGSSVRADNAIWVEAEGFGFAVSYDDVDSAHRRALMDALLSASLAGGAKIQAHSVVSLARVERDLLIVQPTGRVLRHDIIRQTFENNIWNVAVRALIGSDPTDDCTSTNYLHVTAYSPHIRVSPSAPFWTEQLAQNVIQSLLEVLDKHDKVASLRITDRPMPIGISDIQAANDYVALTEGDIRLNPGDFGFAPEIRISVTNDGSTKAILLELGLSLVSSEGKVMRQDLTRKTTIFGSSLFGSNVTPSQSMRELATSDLTDGISETFDELLDIQSCSPLSSLLVFSGTTLSVDLGTRHGLNRGAVAFTVDRSNSVEMLEIITLSESHAFLRPMDPSSSLESFAGRPVQFLDTGL